MQEATLKAIFEIKTSCDALSVRLLRWHWEQTPGKHTLHALMQYVEQRKKQAPEYYARMPEYPASPSWKQLDTTFCMRVLLDPEDGVAGKKTNLLQYALDEHKARRACNGLRIARNEAAHATDKTSAAKAAKVFGEILADLQAAYGILLFSANELDAYVKIAQEAVAATKTGRKPSASTSRTKNGAAKTTARKAATRKTAAREPELFTSFSRENLFWILAIAVFIVAVFLRAQAMA